MHKQYSPLLAILLQCYPNDISHKNMLYYEYIRWGFLSYTNLLRQNFHWAALILLYAATLHFRAVILKFVHYFL